MPSTFAADVIASADGLGEMKLQFSLYTILESETKPCTVLANKLTSNVHVKKGRWEKGKRRGPRIQIHTTRSETKVVKHRTAAASDKTKEV